jgi:aryl sulfotransferase
VWLASYPKSGNTWVRLLLNAVERGEDLDWRRPDGSTDGLASVTLGLPTSATSPEETAALVRLSWVLSHRDLAVPRRRKTHRPWGLAADGYPWAGPGAEVGTRAIHVVRDPRSVAVSWAHHRGCSQEEAVEDLATVSPGVVPWSAGEPVAWPRLGWSEHVASWLDQADLPVLTVRYEDLHADPDGMLTEMAAFAGLSRDAEQIHDAVARCDFAALALRETFEGFAEVAHRDRLFFRRGEVDSWTTELRPDLAASIVETHGAVMRRLGYPTSSET